LPAQSLASQLGHRYSALPSQLPAQPSALTQATAQAINREPEMIRKVSSDRPIPLVWVNQAQRKRDQEAETARLEWEALKRSTDAKVGLFRLTCKVDFAKDNHWLYSDNIDGKVHNWFSRLEPILPYGYTTGDVPEHYLERKRKREEVL